MDDATLHVLRNFLRLVLGREESPFVDVERPPTVEVSGPLASGGGIVPAVGGTLIERPSLSLSVHDDITKTSQPTRDFRPKVDLKVDVVGNEVIVHDGKVVDCFGKEIEVKGGRFTVPEGDLPLFLVYRSGGIVWSANCLPTDIPLFSKVRK